MQVENSLYDVVIIGGSYTGLSAALGLARSLCKVLIIDAGERCNKNGLRARNILLHDGVPPGEVAAQAREEVLKYKNVKFLSGTAVSAVKNDKIFEVTTEAKEKFVGRKLLIATGLKDKILPIPGMAECWGRSAFHCPFIRGYEVAGKSLGVLVSNEKEISSILLIYHLSKDLKIFTNGPSVISQEWTGKFKTKGIPIIESGIEKIEHENGQMKIIILEDGSKHAIDALFPRPPTQQHSSIPKELGCTIDEMGLIQVDEFYRTTVPGVFAAGENIAIFRSLATTIGSGTKSAAFIVKELVEENFAM